jgi:group I intron endonuclease
VNKIAGVYFIRNRATGERYVGSAQNIALRWSQHRNVLRKGVRLSHRFLQAWRTQGEEAFEFAVVETIENPTHEQLEAREQHYIDLWMPEYNVARYAHGVPAKARVIMSRSKKGKPSVKRTDPTKVR